ncbi:MAG: hypothetical protein AAF657_11360 [Acidobacteriota bacterium]
MPNHPRFWIELMGKLGPPICAATVVGCILAGSFDKVHGVLTAVGVGMIAIEHWYSHHHGE